MCGFQGILPFLYIPFCFVLTFPGDDCEEVTPVPIPNTVVKLFHADGTWGLPPWESRSLPGLFFIELYHLIEFFFFWFSYLSCSILNIKLGKVKENLLMVVYGGFRENFFEA